MKYARWDRCARSLARLALGRRRRALGLVAYLGCVGCYQPSESADLPALEVTGDIGLDAGVSSSDMHGAAPDAGPAGAGRKLVFRVRTLAFGGRYAPRNIGAIWVETEVGGYVKTLERWAGTRLRYLRTYQAAARGDVTDAITSATLQVHRTHEVTWNLTDKSGMPVPDGAYRLALELTDRDASGAVHYVPFVKGAERWMLMPPGVPQFQDMVLTLE